MNGVSGARTGAPAEVEMLVAAMLVALLILVLGYSPVPAHSEFWRYYPAGGAAAGAILLIVLILLLLGSQ